MHTNRKTSGRATSVPIGLLWSVIVSVAATVVMSALTAWLAVSEIIRQEHIGYAIMILLPISAFIGAMAAYKKIKRKKMLISMISGLLYFLTLLLVALLFFGGKISAAGETALMVLCGSLIHGLTSIQPSRKRRRKAFS